MQTAQTHSDSGNSITALFKNWEDAKCAYNAVLARGYEREEINLIAPDNASKSYFANKKTGASNGVLIINDFSRKTVEGMLVGSIVGATISALTLAAAIATMGADFIELGAGVVIGGPLAIILTGILGSVGGGLIGALVGTGMPHHDVKSSAITITVNAHSEKDSHELADVWKKYHGENIQR